MFEIIKDDFSIQFSDIQIYEEDFKNHYPINGTMVIRVSKTAYSGISSLDIDGNDLKTFFDTFVKLWESLKPGSCLIKEPYGSQFVSVRYDGSHFLVSGKIGIPFDSKFELVFSETMDQSYLNSFISAIRKFDLCTFLSR